MTSTLTTRTETDRTAPVVRRRPGLLPALRWELRKLRAQIRARAVLVGALLGPVPVVLVLHELGPLKNVIERTVSLDSGHIDDRAFEPTDVCVRPGRQQRSPEPDATAPRSVPVATTRIEVPRND